MKNIKFDPAKCQECGGKCCRGEAGFIWLSKEEIDKIADFLKAKPQDLMGTCVKKVGKKYTIKDIAYKNERICFFFDTQNKNCSIYKVRPMQCKTFPFWKGITREYLEKECIAVSF